MFIECAKTFRRECVLYKLKRACSIDLNTRPRALLILDLNKTEY